jgi:hypothetical protein
MFFLKAVIPDVTLIASAELQYEGNAPHQWLSVSVPVYSTFVNDRIG